jgi:hypothetical protein
MIDPFVCFFSVCGLFYGLFWLIAFLNPFVIILIWCSVGEPSIRHFIVVVGVFRPLDWG